MSKPRCNKCAGPLKYVRVPVLENSAVSDVISCVLCGDIFKERVYCAAPLRSLAAEDLIVKKQPLAICKVPGCNGVHSAKGFCRSHYYADFNRRAGKLKAEYDLAPV